MPVPENHRAFKEFALVCLFLSLAILNRPSHAQAKASSPDDAYVVPIEVTVPKPPITFKADGRWDLCYELRIASLADTGEITITGIEIEGPDEKSLVKLSADEVKASIDSTAAVGAKLGPRAYTTIYMWITASSLDEIPSAIRHRITTKVADEPDELSTATQPVPIIRTPVVAIDPPLRGDHWMAVNGPSDTSSHRRALLPYEGRVFVGQRYAIDWAQLFPDNQLLHGDHLVNRNYSSYGQPVYAVADGTVTEMKDGIPENVPGDSRAVEITLQTVGGNHVIEKISTSVYATYAHMQPGSVRVKQGDRVRRGQILGLVGNSGNSTGPHLHFQLCDANSILACEGIPYAIRSFEVEGRGKAEGPVVTHKMELPTEGEVVKFK
jgi:murein DD-endopeptidase MepM/ murein hydrolase activator NlpD